MLLAQGAEATMVPQPRLQPVLQAMPQPLLQPVLQAVAQRVQPELQPVLQAVAQPVLHGAAATTVVPQLPVPQLLTGVAQLLTGVAQRAAVRFERQVATRPLKTRPPTRLPLSQLVAVSQH
jgi:hypothetical protein